MLGVVIFKISEDKTRLWGSEFLKADSAKTKRL